MNTLLIALAGALVAGGLLALVTGLLARPALPARPGGPGRGAPG